MRNAPESLKKLIAHFDALPGIGPKHAMRLALNLLNRAERARQFSADIVSALDSLNLCAQCFTITEGQLCGLCRDPQRNKNTICVVAHIQDIDPMERTGKFSGVYHVLHGLIDPLEGVTPHEIKTRELFQRIAANGVSEVILALDATSEGEATTLYLSKALKEKNIKTTKLARGLPIGSSIEYADEVTLSSAFEHRQE